MSEKHKMIRGELYDPDDAELVAAREFAAELTAQHNRTAPRDAAVRADLLGRLLGAVGPGVELRPPLYCDYGFNTRIGARTYANFGLVLLDVAAIEIGEDVLIGPNAQLLTATHPLDPALRRAKQELARPISVGDNVWIGAGALILPGVRIGERSVVAAGAVVTKDVPSDVVVAGVPAVVMRAVP